MTNEKGGKVTDTDFKSIDCLRAADAMRSPSERMVTTTAIEATIDGTEAVMAVPLTRAIATSEAATAMVETTADQATAAKSLAVGTINATISETATKISVTSAAMISRSFIALTSDTARSINRASTLWKNVARTHPTRSLTIVSNMRAITKSMMTPPWQATGVKPAEAATRAASATRAPAAAMVVLETTTLEAATPCLQRKNASIARKRGSKRSRHTSQSSVLVTKPLATRRSKRTSLIPLTRRTNLQATRMPRQQ